MTGRISSRTCYIYKTQFSFSLRKVPFVASRHIYVYFNKSIGLSYTIYIKNKLSKSIVIIYKCRNYFDKEAGQNLNFSFIYPYLTYWVEIWGNTCNIHLDPVVML